MSYYTKYKNFDKSKEINSILINNQMLNATDEPHNISNIFNTFFINIGSKLAENNTVNDNPIGEIVELVETRMITFLTKR